MYKTLIKNATLLQMGNPLNGQKVDILTGNGIILECKNDITDKADEIIDLPSLYVSEGWFDFRVSFGDPGYEHREDLETGCAAAESGGFTEVAMAGNTVPALHGKTQIEYIQKKNAGNKVKIHPIGTITMDNAGNDLSELYDMNKCGVKAFSDHKKAIQNPHLLMRALLYCKSFNGLIIQLPNDNQLAQNGKMHEGYYSTLLGLKAQPSLAEEIMLQRDISLAAFTDCRIHFGGISSEGSVNLVRKAKAEGLKISCDVHINNLCFTDEILQGFDSNYKIMPPLRSEKDRLALIEGIKDGTIDVICSDHTPVDKESKVQEFDIAPFGISGIETFWPSVVKSVWNLCDKNTLIEKFTSAPRKILGLNHTQIKKGEKCNLTVFTDEGDFILNTGQQKSKSENNPRLGQKLMGRVIKTL